MSCIDGALRADTGRLDKALALLRLLGADRACTTDYCRNCHQHSSPMPPSATRCTVGAAWDALGVEG